jgi:two-component system, LytTR family, sensor histidine kinase AlgZ
MASTTPGPSATSGRTLAYLACQLGGWGAYALLNVAATAGVGAHGGVPVGQACWVSLCGGLLTDRLRRQATRARWAERGVVALLVRIAVSALLVGSAMTILALLSSWFVLHAFAPRETSAGVALVYVFNFSFLVLAWQLLYFGEHALTRSRRAELQRLQLESASREAELAALKAQLNPHFLFNCLNSIRALIEEDPPRAQHVVTLLSGLMRYSLSAAASATVPLARELDVVRDYLELESVRLEERLEVHIDVPPECLVVPVPSMIVQSLVENAIKHGIAPLPDGGLVSVTARREGERLVLDVANTAGAERAAPGSGAGVGLRNARERLRLLFGGAASLDLDRTEPERTHARLSLPAVSGPA